MVKSIDALGHESLSEYDAQGRAFKQSAPDGSSVSTEYDLEGRALAVTRRSSDGQTQITRTAYDVLGRAVSSTDALGHVSHTEYDSLGRVSASIDPSGLRTEYFYDPASGGGRQLEVRAPGGTLKYGYDVAGRRVNVTDALGHVTSSEFDSAGRPVATVFPDGSRSSVEYDSIGRRIASLDEMGKRTEFAYDAAGRLASVTDALGQVTRFEYDSRGLMTKQIDAKGHFTLFGYDISGRRITRSLPLGMSESLSYNQLGQVTSRSDFAGMKTQFKYDEMGRLIEKTADANHPSLALTHAASKITYQYDSFGRLSQGKVWHGGALLHSSSHSYNANGQMIQRATDEGAIDYGFDAAGRLLSAKSDRTAGHEVSYVYDAAGRLSAVNAIDASGVTRSANYSYDAIGNLATQQHGAVTQSFAYDNRNRLSNLSSTVSGLSFAYTVNLCGRRTQVIENTLRIIDYDYDALHRLISESENGVGLSQYNLDAVGNRTQRSSTLPGVNAQSLSYDANDRLIGDSYDANGNTLVSGSGTDTYDFENRLIRRVLGSRAIDLYYDAAGQRVAKKVNGHETAYLLDTQNPTGYAQCVEEQEQIAGLLTVTRRAYFGLQLFAEEEVTWTGDTPSSVLRFAHQDGHGSTRAISDATGAISGEYVYDAFGILRNSQGGFDLHHRYCGEFFDADLGMYYLRARWYQPELGRFWTMDTYEGRSGEPITLHKYLYCGADGVNGRDPSGYQNIEDTGAAITIGECLMLMRVSPYVGSMVTVGRVTELALANLWRLELAAGATALVGVGLGALSEELDGVIKNAAVKASGSPTLRGDNVGREFETMFDMTGSDDAYQGTDKIIVKSNGRVDALSLTTRVDQEGMSDERYIQIVKQKLLQKIGQPATENSIGTGIKGAISRGEYSVKSSFRFTYPSIPTSNVDTHNIALGIPETRAHLIGTSQFVRMLEEVRDGSGCVSRILIMPLRWRR